VNVTVLLSRHRSQLPSEVRQYLTGRAWELSSLCLFDPLTQRGTCEFSVLRNDVCVHGWAVYADLFGIDDVKQSRSLWERWARLVPRLPSWAVDDPIAVWEPSRAVADPIRWPAGRTHRLSDLAAAGEISLLTELPMQPGNSLIGVAGGTAPRRVPKQGGRRRKSRPPGGVPSHDAVRVPATPFPDPHSLVSPTVQAKPGITMVGGRRVRQRSARGMRLAMRTLASATVARAKRCAAAPPAGESPTKKTMLDKSAESATPDSAGPSRRNLVAGSQAGSTPSTPRTLFES
jgi:hypothetical protein